VTQLDPVQLWRRFKRNTLLYARLWLETGELPESCHFTIRERLEPWIAAVTAGSPEVREALLAVVPPIPPREPEPTRDWIMAAIGFAFFVYSIVGWLLDANLPGWTSLMAAVGLLGGMQFLMLGIIGAYLGRLYDQSKGRPLFMIRDIVGGPK